MMGLVKSFMGTLERHSVHKAANDLNTHGGFYINEDVPLSAGKCGGWTQTEAPPFGEVGSRLVINLHSPENFNNVLGNHADREKMAAAEKVADRLADKLALQDNVIGHTVDGLVLRNTEDIGKFRDAVVEYGDRFLADKIQKDYEGTLMDRRAEIEDQLSQTVVSASAPGSSTPPTSAP